MSDLKTSLLINTQVPEFIREEYPKFISFLEAYYEFLENSEYAKNKDLRYISDVDLSLDEFEQQFYNTFLPFLPRDQEINKELIIKNILPIYLAKGSEKSYKLLFRMLFGEEMKIESPGNQILRASDGRWTVENFLRVEVEVRSEYVSDGVQTVYLIPYVADASSISVRLNGIPTTNYVLRKEYKKLIFNTAPAKDVVVTVNYTNFDTSLLENRKVIGVTSRAEAIVEKVGKKSSGGQAYYQLFVNKKNTIGTFSNGELLEIDIVQNNTTIPILLQSYSDVESINIIEGGANYSVGDQVIVLGASKKTAIAIVDQVSSGVIKEITINDGGSGYRVGNNVISQGIDTSIFFSKIVSVDDSGTTTPNSLTFNTDIISDFANTAINSVNYGFPNAGTENANSVIANALTTSTIMNLGSVSQINVEVSKITNQTTLDLIGEPSVLYGNVTIGDLGVIGRIDILEPGISYNVGDKLIFTNEISFAGQGANAYVSSVAANGAITGIHINTGGLAYDLAYPPKITINSTYGANANLVVGSIMGRDLDIIPRLLNDFLGKILSVKVLSPGVGYTATPTIDLSRSGDGKAVAEAIMRSVLVELPGKWSTEDGIISNDDIRLQGRDYYINYSYVINSKVEFDKYKAILKNLLHPAGFINYSKYNLYDSVDSRATVSAESSVIKTVSGTVNISNNSNNIIGVNTDFVTAQTLGIIQTGNVIAIGNFTAEIVSVDSANSLIVSNVTTHYSNSENNIVTSVVTYSANSEIIKILT